MDKNKIASAYLKRAFLVLVDEASWDVKQQSYKHDIKCITQLMGAQQHIDTVKAEAEKVNKGPWENVDQFKVM